MARGHRRLAAWADPTDIETARLELLEGFLNRSEVADCTEFALEWLAHRQNITQAICLARREGDSMLSAIGAYGLRPSASVASFVVPTEDWRHPLIQILANRRHTFFPAITGSGHDPAAVRIRPSRTTRFT